jgi:hypothetical protein
LTGCGGPRLLPQLFAEKLEVPASLLECSPPPAHRPIDSQRDLALLVTDLAEAGADCRDKLQAVRQVVTGPPQQP